MTNRRLIEPLDFANVLASVQFWLGKPGISRTAAVSRACIDQGLHTDWLVPLTAFVEHSPVTAEAWSKRIFQEHLDRVGKFRQSVAVVVALDAAEEAACDNDQSVS